MFCVYSAVAQSPRLSQSDAKPVPFYCKAPALDNAEFMNLIKTIVIHGDLTDFAFVERALNAKFRLGYGWKPNGNPDPQTLIYQTNKVLGAPIHVTLTVRTSKAEQSKYDFISSLIFDNQLFPKANFLTDCLRISTSEIYSSYGHGFLVGLATEGGFEAGGSQEQGSPGRNGSKLYFEFDYRTKDNLVDRMAIVQQP
jgi:hypothetical protein